MSTKNREINPIEYSVNGKKINFCEPRIMAIVNLTPDSFYDGGKYDGIEDVIRDVEEKISQGAHIIDIGAASSRPNAVDIGEEEEWSRLRKILPVIRKKFPGIPISVDTFRAPVALRSAEEGADMINDIGGGSLDARMFETIAKMQLPYILMHIQGTPQTMQQQPHYEDVVQEVCADLRTKVQQLEELDFFKIIIDPGFGFGKTLENNYQLLRHFEVLKEMGYPLLAGVSRKGMINRVIGTNPVTSLNGTTVLNTIALLNGASILRVHDVSEALQAIKLVQFYKNV